MSYEEGDISEPVRIYSDAAGAGIASSLAFSPRGARELPVALKGTADEELSTLAASTNPINIDVLFAMAAAIFQMRERLTGWRPTPSVGNEAACAALTKCTAKNKGALLLGYAA